MRAIRLMVLLSLLVMPAELLAAEPDNYGVIKLGYFLPNSDSEGLKHYDNTAGFGVAFGHEFSRGIAAEIGLDYYTTAYEASGAIQVVDAESRQVIDGRYTLDRKISVRAVPATVKYCLPVSNQIKVFTGAGIGYYWVDFEADLSVTAQADRSTSDSGTCFGYHLVAGAQYAVLTNLALGLELKWSKAEQEIAAEGKTFDVNVGGTAINLVGKMLF